MSYKEAKQSWKEILTITKVAQANAQEVLPEEENAANVKQLQKLAEQCRKLAAELEYLAPVPSSGIEAFFDAVGQGVVNAQQTLDDQTAIYLSKKSSFPTAFRIPKASAEIQFSALERKDGGFLARIFTDATATEKAIKHKVTFDIVAAPLPPELVQRPSLPWLSAFVVTDLPTRRFLLKEVEKFPDSLSSQNLTDIEKKSLQVRAKRLCESFNRTVILQIGSAYAILLLQKNGAAKTVLEILQLDAPDNDGKRKISFIDSPTSPYPTLETNLLPLYNSFMQVLDEQEARLRKLDELYPPNPSTS